MIPEKQSNSIKGGRRVGAGRKKGVPNKLTATLRAKLAETGMTPLEVMYRAMNELCDAANRMKPDQYVKIDAKVMGYLDLLGRAAEIASKLAPYLHPKLQSIEHKGEGGGPIQQRVVVEFV